MLPFSEVLETAFRSSEALNSFIARGAIYLPNLNSEFGARCYTTIIIISESAVSDNPQHWLFPSTFYWYI